MTRTISVAVIGLGSRGLGVLERIVTLAKKAGPDAGEVHVHLVDPTCVGAGVHDTAQPDYLLLNTTAAHVSLFPDECTVGDAVDEPGMNLYEWVTERGLRLAEDGFTVGTVGRAIRPTDFLPRRVLGEYLAWFFEQVRLRVPPHVRLTTHEAVAVDLASTPGFSLDAELLDITLSDGTVLQVDYAFLTTGYTANDALPPGSGGIIAEPYPLPERVADIAAGQTVAICGFGLSAMDLMSCLTVGRGGRFVPSSPDGSELSYVPSGQEPTLLFYSRTGVPCRARPKVVEFGPQYRPLAFTTTNVDILRTSLGGGPLDFEADVLPLVFTEMRIGYRRCEARLADAGAGLGHRGAADALERELEAAAADGPDALVALLDALDTRLGPFDPVSTFDGATDMLLDDTQAYQKWLADVLRGDLAEGLLGFVGSPVKAALDVMRELRDTFRYVVDFGGLTEASLDEFTRRTVPAVNRAVVGPQFERHAELLALMAAGVAHVPFGPAPTVVWTAPSTEDVDTEAGGWTVTSTRLAEPHSRDVDWVVAAYVEPPAVDTSSSPLLTALHRRGSIRRHRPDSRHVHGIDVDPDQHPIATDGHPDTRVWVLGPLCEGATFYNNLVPSPNTWSRPIHDAHRCVAAMLTAAHARTHPTPLPT